jgi:hypothetical protein
MDVKRPRQPLSYHLVKQEDGKGVEGVSIRQEGSKPG